MARTNIVTLLIACGLVAALCSATQAFIGAARSAVAPGLRGNVAGRAPGMELSAGYDGTGYGSSDGKLADETYVIGITLFFFVSLAANVSGFFNGPIFNR